MILDRGVNFKANWQNHTLRSLLEAGSWISVIASSYLSMSTSSDLARIVLSALSGGISGLLVCTGSEFLVRQCRYTSSNSSADSNTAINLYMIMSLGLLMVKLIFHHFAVCATAIALASISGIVMVLVGDCIVRMETTAKAGYIIKQRIKNAASNWKTHPIRSFYETSMWLGSIFAHYSVFGSIVAAAQFGTICGILVVLLCHELSRDNTLVEKEIMTQLDSVLAVGRKLPDVSVESTSTKKPRQKLPSYTMEEVAKHNTLTDCWLVYQGQVYDISKWSKYHPGGIRPIERFAGLDATDELRAFHNDAVLQKKLPVFLIGTVADAPDTSALVEDFRSVYKYLDNSGYFKKDLSDYYPRFAVIGAMFVSVWLMLSLSSNNWVHLAGAVMLGMFWQQTAFIGHDCGHISINVDREKDYFLGFFVGNLFTGISIGWWKDTHNTHHAVPNSVADDPDIAHLPVFAVTEKYFNSLYNSYHNRVFEFDWAARNIFIPNQHILYYPIMMLARFNLYLQGIIRLCKASNVHRRTEDLLYQIGFFVWMGALLSLLNSWGMVLAFLLLSHATAGLLQVQITLSHFSRDVNEGREDGYGGDFCTRNVVASLDVDCHRALDWLHGGLQFQTIHHLFPRMGRRYLRTVRPIVQALCKKHNLPYTEMSFWEGNMEIMDTLRRTAIKSKTWSPLIWESVNAEG